MTDLMFYYPTLIAPYKGWSDKQLVTGTHYIATCMIGNQYFTTLADEIAAFAEQSENFGNKVAVATNRDKNDVIAKDLVRLSLIGDTLNLGNSVTKIANGELQVLASSGMPLRKRAQPIVLTMPANLVLSVSNVTGELTTRVDSVKGARSYVVKYTQDP